jgi:hypothetical protein
MSDQYRSYPQGPPRWQPPPPKPKNSVRNVLLACVLGLVGLVVSCSALVAVSGEGESTDASGGPAPTVTVTARPAPMPLRATAAPSGRQEPAATAAPTQSVKRLGASCSEDKNEPCTVKAGQTFTRGKHQTLAGWKIKRGPLDWFDVVAKVRNISDEESGAVMTFKFLRGNEVLGSVMCTSTSLEPGQSQALNCISADDYTTKYDRITVEATF